MRCKGWFQFKLNSFLGNIFSWCCVLYIASNFRHITSVSLLVMLILITELRRQQPDLPTVKLHFFFQLQPVNNWSMEWYFCIWKFTDQGWNLYHSSDPSLCNAGFFTYCATRELQGIFKILILLLLTPLPNSSSPLEWNSSVESH